MKKWIALVVLTAACITGYVLWNNWQKAHAEAASPTRPTTATVGLRNI